MTGIDDADFPSTEELSRWCSRIGEAGYRGTGTAAHAQLVDWVESELQSLGLDVRRDEFPVLRWRPVPEGDLSSAGRLRIDDNDVPVAGAVPYSRPGDASGRLVHLGPGEPITAENAGGRVVIRDFPSLPLPYDYLLDSALHRTPDTAELRGRSWDRPGLADTLLHEDLLAAGAAGAVAVIVAFDLPREQVAGYHEPHKGTHYAVPAVFVGADERATILGHEGRHASVGVDAVIESATTANLHATLPGRRRERAVLVTHTDGNTWVQENGVAALLAIATHLAGTPEAERDRSVEFVFTTAHLHISREGAARYAGVLDEHFDDGDVAYVFPLEHLGVRALEPVTRDGGPGRRLEFSGEDELLLWAAGPSPAIRDAVRDAIVGRGLERTVLVPGLGAPVAGQVPEIASFGGIGTLFHTHLIPTTTFLTGPWSLWAPHFGSAAIDVGLLRRQALAAADVVAALDGVDRAEIVGGYADDRRARAAGAPVALDPVPPERAPELDDLRHRARPLEPTG